MFSVTEFKARKAALRRWSRWLALSILACASITAREARRFGGMARIAGREQYEGTDKHGRLGPPELNTMKHETTLPIATVEATNTYTITAAAIATAGNCALPLLLLMSPMVVALLLRMCVLAR